MELTGSIHKKGNDEQVSASFKKRELVIKTEEQYPQFISINFVQDKVDLIDPYNVGENVTVSINLRGKEWTNPQGEVKYFNDLQGWKIQRNATEAPQPNPNETFTGKKVFTEPLGQANEPDDLPFN